MQFDKNNKIVKLCAEGIKLEGQGLKSEACNLFQQAWDEATNDFEKFTAAHYVARNQPDIANKLKWDESALNLALELNDDKMNNVLPSLYLNVGKCYEDLKDFENAIKHYDLGLTFVTFLPDDGYGQMIKGGLKSGIDRVKLR